MLSCHRSKSTGEGWRPEKEGGRGQAGRYNCVESHLESIDALPLVSMEAKSVTERCGEGLKSRNFSVPHREKQTVKVPDPPTFSPFPDISFPEPPNCIPLHCFFITEGS